MWMRVVGQLGERCVGERGGEGRERCVGEGGGEVVCG